MNTDPERVGIAGDWHGNSMWAVAQVKAMGERLDGEPRKIILHAGDFGVWPGDGPYLTVVQDALTGVDAELWFIDGNHSEHPRLLALLKDRDSVAPIPLPGRDRIMWLPRSCRWAWHGRRWVALGGAVSLDKVIRQEGVSWWPQEAITDADEARVITGGKADVMLTHDRPSGAAMDFPAAPPWWDPADQARSDAHRERLQRIVDAVRPDHLVHGHVHQGGPWWKTQPRSGGYYKVASLDCDGSGGNTGILNVRTMEWEK